MNQKVVILGGGVAGLSAAHELIERGFDVEVYEFKGIPGGKARSIPVPDSATDGRQPLPGEHGFRFFPGFYKHLPDTMKRIPFAGNAQGVFDNLVQARYDAFASYDNGLEPFLATFPTEPEDFVMLFKTMAEMLEGKMGITPKESLLFTKTFWQILTSCEERIMQEYQNMSWWDFSDAGKQSPEYQTFMRAFTRTLVAAKSDEANARTIGNVGAALLVGPLSPGTEDDRVLDGPTNGRWIDPWLTYLREQGVRYYLNAEVLSIQMQNGLISSATVQIPDGVIEVTGDQFLCAFPVEVMAKLITDEMIAAAPELEKVKQLAPYTEWMNGIQFYLLEDAPLIGGHVAYMNSPWALTSISQRQFWKNINFQQLGDGEVKGILSVDISDWTVPGLCGKPAMQCTPQEVKDDVWNQLKKSLNVNGQVLLRDDMLHSWFIDPDIHFENPHDDINMEPLLVNNVGTWELRPEAATSIPNLFLASDYVRTNTDLATMEGANEAARHAVNAILTATGSTATPCQIFPMYNEWKELREPFMLHDKHRFEKGLPWDGHLIF